jgi:CRP-like cAMP-binding protein
MPKRKIPEATAQAAAGKKQRPDGVASDGLDHLQKPLSYDELLKLFLPAGSVRMLAPGEELMTAGKAAHSLYLVMEGSIELYKSDGTALGTSLNLEQGRIVGELSFLSGNLPSVTAVAAKAGLKVKVAELGHSQLEQQLRDQASLASRFMVSLAGRLSTKVSNMNDALLASLTRPPPIARQSHALQEAAKETDPDAVRASFELPRSSMLIAAASCFCAIERDSTPTDSSEHGHPSTVYLLCAQAPSSLLHTSASLIAPFLARHSLLPTYRAFASAAPCVCVCVSAAIQHDTRCS